MSVCLALPGILHAMHPCIPWHMRDDRGEISSLVHTYPSLVVWRGCIEAHFDSIIVQVVVVVVVVGSSVKEFI